MWDKQEMEPALNELKKVEEKLGPLVADAGYHHVERCVEQDIEPYIAGSREHHNQALEDRSWSVLLWRFNGEVDSGDGGMNYGGIIWARLPGGLTAGAEKAKWGSLRY